MNNKRKKKKQAQDLKGSRLDFYLEVLTAPLAGRSEVRVNLEIGRLP
jgi:hypothetical protein